MPTDRPLGLSAFLRCKNEEEYIVASILSSYRVFDEIVVVLNNSTDNTRALIEDLMTDHPKIKLYTYDYECAPVGPGYIEAVRADPTKSLAAYYNWCLERTTYSHVCKWDGDMIAIPPFEEVRGLIADNNLVSIDGWDPLGQPTVNHEARIFKFDPAHTKYADWDLYEVLQHDYAAPAMVQHKCYVHMKLVKREWVHRAWVNPNDFATSAYPAPGSGRIGGMKESRLRRLTPHLRNAVRHMRAAVRERVLRVPKRYAIRGDYAHRDAVSHFDDTSFTDEYQREVYERAAELAKRDGLHTIYDVGCGSGYKLVHYLGDFDTTGFEVPQTLEYLRRQYPDRKWAEVSFSDRNVPRADIVICSDVIEHVPDPDALMNFLVSVTGRWLVLSTADRELAYSKFSPYQLGPPSSEHHMREWSMDEFRRYIEQFVDVVEHVHSHPGHSTQMIVARPRR